MKSKESAPDKKLRHSGVSVRFLSALLFAAAVLGIGLSLFGLRQTMVHTKTLYKLEQEREACDNAIMQFMDGSDYLTTQVQQFVISCDRTYMDNYWTEVYETKSRDEAIDVILNIDITDSERKRASAGKSESDSLIQGEIWAMRIVSESIGIDEADMPRDVATRRLGLEDEALSPQEKREAAIAYIFGPDYSTAKGVIRGNVNEFRGQIAKRYGEEATAALTDAERSTGYIALGIISFFILLAVSIISLAHQVIYPIIRFSDELNRNENGTPIVLRARGTMEINHLAHAFNALYSRVEQNTERLARLGYYDYLTGVPNRAGITEYVEEIINKSNGPLGLMMIDIDNFKRFNDTYGHAVGDRVLKLVAKAVCTAQEGKDGISGRLCGEEFVVAISGAGENSLCETAQAVLSNVRSITNTQAGLLNVPDFQITVSAGGMLWQGERPTSFVSLLSKADKALYISKDNGKDCYTFFKET